jgi:TMEM175 potassium channel family protein
MSEAAKESLHKEFELERMILFSDAVFAIAITLLILEIKFPELPKDSTTHNALHLLYPTFIHFGAFVVSFFFIGMSWARHLTLCKFLKQYNNTVIFYNLLLLFFIVTFPFSISAFIDNIRTAYLLAIFTYFSNIVLVLFAQFLFARYILKKNTSLTVASMEKEKQYFYIKAKYSFLMLLASFTTIVVTSIISHGNILAVACSLYILPIFAIIMKIKLKTYKRKNLNSVTPAIN